MLSLGAGSGKAQKKRDKEVPRGMIYGILFRIGDQQLVDDADENIADDKDGNPAPPLHIGRDEVGVFMQVLQAVRISS